MNHARFVTVKLAADLLGLKPKDIQNRIQRCVWAEGRQYKRATDGRTYIDMQGVEKWVSTGKA